jgi:2-polyprenyl-3-methyl-5-hydroxy-6-metoxy-1,4-benzoquinol methylase
MRRRIAFLEPRNTTGTVSSPAAIECPVCGAGEARPVWREGEYDLVRCPTCELVYVGNPPDDRELERLYSFESGFHTELASNSDDQNSASRENALHHLEVIARTQRPGRLLDVGCATGRFLTAAAERGWQTEGVELNGDTAEIARDAGHEVTIGTLENLGPTEQFDTITMWDVVEHVSDPLSLLKAARERLAPDGRLWLATPNVDGLFPQASLRVAAKVGRWPHPEPPYHLSQFSERTLRHTLDRAGFARIEVTHERIPLGFTFGSRKVLLAEPRRLAYTVLFAPLAIVGPWVNRGDTMIVSARPT